MEFRIERASAENYAAIAEVIQQVWEQLPRKDWFVADDAEYIDHILHTGKGIAYMAMTDAGSLAGVFIVTFPKSDEENLGRDIGLPEEEWNGVAHMDSVAILPEYRGHNLQFCLMQTAEEELRHLGYHSLMCTVHPDNVFSKGNIEKQGYVVVKTTEKYGGYQRDILMKTI